MMIDKRLYLLLICIMMTAVTCLGRQLAAPLCELGRTTYTAGVSQDIVLRITAGERLSLAQLYVLVPKDIVVTLDNTTVNVIGRGETTLRGLAHQSVGRVGSQSSRRQVGTASLTDKGRKGTLICLSGLDLRPHNGTDVELVIRGAMLESRTYVFETWYAAPDGYRMSHRTKARIRGLWRLADLKRCMPQRATLSETPDLSFALLCWTPLPGAPKALLKASTDRGRSWTTWADLSREEYNNYMYAARLQPHQHYAFRIDVLEGRYKGSSNIVWYYSGMYNVLDEGLRGNGIVDEAPALDRLLKRVSAEGGGLVRFPKGEYAVSTVHLQSNVWLYLDEGATLKALPGGDPPEATWFDDHDYRSGLSPTDMGPYRDPENYMTKQDVGHTFFKNAMFVGERIENVKVVGRVRISGNGNLVTSDKVMNNEPSRRHDKMFSLKLCRNIEIGGLTSSSDLWYDEHRDKPYYITDGADSTDLSNMLHIDQAGHFAVLATGTDNISVHDTYFGRHSSAYTRDIYDFMGCNDVTVNNIYVTVASDDIVKLGSDCSLGFTRPGSRYRVRNVIGDTNCNLFQIGSETADDITDVAVDNICVLGANKAGVSISVNDGGTVSHVWLNSGKTGSLHHRSVMRRTRSPFFLSISNRGRVLGAEARLCRFVEGANVRRELLITNIPIGRIEHVNLNGVDINEVYGGSSFRAARWRPYDGKQHTAPAIIAGYQLPSPENLIDGGPLHLPDGCRKRYIEHVILNDITLIAKGGQPAARPGLVTPEIGVGRYNVGDLKDLPSHSLWLRHVNHLLLQNCVFETELPDGRPDVVADDVLHLEKTNRSSASLQ